MTKGKSIRIDRRIDLEWLDAVASAVAAGQTEKEIREKLFAMLEGEVSGGSKNGSSAYKTVAILAQVWFKVPALAEPMQGRALKLLADASHEERVAIHWAMLVSRYPFFTELTRHIGRLLKLQGNLALSQVQQRMRESWGERSTLAYAVQKIVACMRQWAVLKETDDIGVYEAAPRIPVSEAYSFLLLEALLIDKGEGTMQSSLLLNHPSFFPFELGLQPYQMRQSPVFQVHRQGLDIDMVELATLPGPGKART